jgi:hypothetical protein
MGEWKNQRTCHAAGAPPATYSHTQEHIHIRKKTYSYTQDHIQSHTHKVIRIRRSTLTYTKNAYDLQEKYHIHIWKKSQKTYSLTSSESPRTTHFFSEH